MTSAYAKLILENLTTICRESKRKDLSANAPRFMPLDGLADVAEYTTRKIIELIGR